MKTLTVTDSFTGELILMNTEHIISIGNDSRHDKGVRIHAVNGVVYHAAESIEVIEKLL